MLEGFINGLENVTGLDIDGDGGIGDTGIGRTSRDEADSLPDAAARRLSTVITNTAKAIESVVAQAVNHASITRDPQTCMNRERLLEVLEPAVQSLLKRVAAGDEIALPLARCNVCSMEQVASLNYREFAFVHGGLKAPDVSGSIAAPSFGPAPVGLSWEEDSDSAERLESKLAEIVVAARRALAISTVGELIRSPREWIDSDALSWEKATSGSGSVDNPMIAVTDSWLDYLATQPSLAERLATDRSSAPTWKETSLWALWTLSNRSCSHGLADCSGKSRSIRAIDVYLRLAKDSIWCALYPELARLSRSEWRLYWARVAQSVSSSFKTQSRLCWIEVLELDASSAAVRTKSASTNLRSFSPPTSTAIVVTSHPRGRGRLEVCMGRRASAKGRADRSLSKKTSAEKTAAGKTVAEKAVAEKVAAEKVAAEKVAAEEAAAEAAAAEAAAEAAAAEKAAAEKAAAEKAAAEEVAAERAAKEEVIAKKAAAVKTKVSKKVASMASKRAAPVPVPVPLPAPAPPVPTPRPVQEVARSISALGIKTLSPAKRAASLRRNAASSRRNKPPEHDSDSDSEGGSFPVAFIASSTDDVMPTMERGAASEKSCLAKELRAFSTKREVAGQRTVLSHVKGHHTSTVRTTSTSASSSSMSPTAPTGAPTAATRSTRNRRVETKAERLYDNILFRSTSGMTV
jgi:hypothetical protein